MITSLINKLGALTKTYRNGGIRSVIEKVGKHVLVSSTVSSYIKRVLGDDLHQSIYMYLRLGYWPHIRNPRTFNEKIMHRKLYTSDERFSIVEDKWRVREYVAERVGEEILPELYQVTNDPEKIRFDDLPDEYVIKPTHMSGPVLFIDEDKYPNRERIKRTCDKWLNTIFGEVKGEYWYSEIKPRIIIEEYLHDEEHGVPPDYKFFCFHGEVEYIEVDIDRQSDHKRRFYSSDWKPQKFELNYPLGPETTEPNKFNEMKEISEKLAEEFDFIRVDLYQPNGDEIIFGELTVAHGSGGERFLPQKYDFKFGSLW